MKTRHAFVILAASLCSAGAQVIGDQTPPAQITNQFSFSALPDPSTWPGTAIDWCSTARQFTQWITNNQTGQVTTRTPQFVEVCGGLNYLDSGTWRESKDLIELTPDGGAAMLQAANRIYFNSSLTATMDGAIKIVTRSNILFNTYPMGVYYYDQAAGKEVLLAPLQGSTPGTLQPPNRVLYPSAFHSPLLEADLRITCTKAGIECDTIITKKPKSAPDAFGLDPSTTLLQVRHAWFTTALPRSVVIKLDSDLIDTGIDFGDMLFAPGRAFAWDGASVADTNVPAQISFLSEETNSTDVTVGKTWQPGNPNILTESVRWNDVVQSLAQLPEMAKVNDDSQPGSVAPGPRQPAGLKPTLPVKRAIQVATSSPRGAGFVLDWMMVTGNGDYEFHTFNGVSNSYYLTANNVFNGNVTFDPSCVIKRVRTGASLILDGSVLCDGSAAQPSILTMEDDDVFGQGDLIPPSNVNCPQITSGPAVWVWYSMPGNVALSCMRIRWAQTAVEFDGSNCSTTRALQTSLVDSCTTGVYANSCTVSITESTACDVTTLTSTTGCTISGTFSAPTTLADSTISTMQTRTATAGQGIWQYINGFPASYDPNSLVYGLTGYTCMSPSNSAAPGSYWYQNPCVLVTPYHAISVSPYHAGGSLFSNFLYRFIDSNNHHQVVQCVSHVSITNNGQWVDIGILRFDQAVTNVAMVRLLPDVSQKLPFTRLNNDPGFGPPLECKLQSVPCILTKPASAFKVAFVKDWFALANNYYGLAMFEKSLWISGWDRDIVGGDSGHPMFMIVNNELAFIGPVANGYPQGRFGGVMTNNINTAIYVADVAAYGQGSGKTVATVDVSSFPNL